MRLLLTFLKMDDIFFLINDPWGREMRMKNIEKVRRKLNRAISSGYSQRTILDISRQLDELIVEKMKSWNKKYIKNT